MKDRIRKIRKESSEKTLEKFGKKIGISAPSVSMLESGKNKPSRQTVVSICKNFNVNEEWLLTGEGEPYIKPEPHAEINERLAKVQLMTMNDTNKEQQRVARFKERLASAILSMSDESCDALIDLINILSDSIPE